VLLLSGIEDRVLLVGTETAKMLVFGLEATKGEGDSGEAVEGEMDIMGIDFALFLSSTFSLLLMNPLGEGWEKDEKRPSLGDENPNWKSSFSSNAGKEGKLSSFLSDLEVFLLSHFLSSKE